ncbi:MAG: WYL domain-containing protein [Thermoguttaceae bacterium]|nr:WYL domain-containing protein [Thermoguttaceae bacterium]MDW8079476.1 WYL domain-containing protein [Thermoguttaceae bacterium]
MPRKSKANNVNTDGPLVRQWILLRLLGSRWTGVTVEEMARELQTSVKTIRRDLALFRRLGFPLAEIRQAHGKKKWTLYASGGEPRLSFAFDEALALYLSRRLLDPIAGTPFWEAAQRAFRKIRAMLSSEALKYAEKLARFFYPTAVGVSDYSGQSQLIDLLLIGIEDQRAVEMTYTSLRAQSPETYRVHPYGMIYHRGSLYLVGYSTKHKEIRHWKVDRMQQAELTDECFQRPENFDLHAHMADSFGVFHETGNTIVRIRFAPEVSRYVQEKRWHASQRIFRENDGSIVVEFRLGGIEEIKHWILSFGGLAEALEPPELRRELAIEAQALATLYSAELASCQRGVPKAVGELVGAMADPDFGERESFLEQEHVRPRMDSGFLRQPPLRRDQTTKPGKAWRKSSKTKEE